jgi:hypothetical protein
LLSPDGDFILCVNMQEGRMKSLDELAELKKQVCKLDEELNAYGACDPVKLEETRRAITLAKEAALRWTGECKDSGAKA